MTMTAPAVAPPRGRRKLLPVLFDVIDACMDGTDVTLALRDEFGAAYRRQYKTDAPALPWDRQDRLLERLRAMWGVMRRDSPQLRPQAPWIEPDPKKKPRAMTDGRLITTRVYVRVKDEAHYTERYKVDILARHADQTTLRCRGCRHARNVPLPIDRMTHADYWQCPRCRKCRDCRERFVPVATEWRCPRCVEVRGHEKAMTTNDRHLDRLAARLAGLQGRRLTAAQTKEQDLREDNARHERAIRKLRPLPVVRPTRAPAHTVGATRPTAV